MSVALVDDTVVVIVSMYAVESTESLSAFAVPVNVGLANLAIAESIYVDDIEDPCHVPEPIVPSVVIFEDPAHVDRAVFSTFPRPTDDLSNVCHDLSPRQYWLVVPEVIVGSLPLNAVVTVVAKLASFPSAVASSFKVSKVDGADATRLDISVRTKAVVAICVVLVAALAVGADGVPVSVGDDKGAYVDKSIDPHETTEPLVVKYFPELPLWFGTNTSIEILS